MKLEALTVALRPRTAWEACELGMALVRRNAGAIWKPWLLVTLPLLVLLNAAGWALDLLWLSGLLMWWLKPWFDRIPLYVISRAVFGETPTPRQTVRAALRWGGRWWLPYLTWRRLGPARPLYLPVDLLEGGDSGEARQRRAALGAPVYGVCSLLTLVCANFELVMILGLVFAGIMFVPFDYLPDTFKSLWDAFLEQPHWMNALFNALAWIAASLIEPFYVGAGFGLYLNRRTEIEGWDIEIVFRRLRARLSAAAAPALLALCVGVGLGAWLPQAMAQSGADRSAQFEGGDAPAADRETDEARIERQARERGEAVAAQMRREAEAAARDAAGAVSEDATGEETVTEDAVSEEPASEEAQDDASYEEEDAPSFPSVPIRGPGEKAADQPSTLDGLYGPARSDDRSLRNAVEQAMKDPTVAPKQKQTVWKSRAEADKPKTERRRDSRDFDGFKGLSGGLATGLELALWGVVALVVGALLFSMGRWLGWFRGGAFEEEPAPGELRNAALAEPEPLPDDIPTAIRRLWQGGRARDALALMYRAAVESMAQRAQVTLVPGATEAQCLRASRKLPLAEDRDAFARAVRVWQYAAYAQTLPGGDDFDDLVALLSRRFGWAA
ncbi:DUF4129 domain-containing protein [Lysobacter enzymogenes]|uniref:DUF4129 domain-containing protein n=1 Tax=Lysobacter enzymogenes TaxID=69 RepID=UPI001AF72283|nr:DUF4129 domain-containing protein [Lysobacter enzymogenes]QQQ01693.1 DUF4129 domain-containing protein [Lysobacter enzymogenes]